MTATKKENKRKQKKERSSTYGFLFYSVALFVWALYDFVLNDKTGWQMPILHLVLEVLLILCITWSNYQDQPCFLNNSI